MKVSAVVPAHNEEGNLPKLVPALKRALSKLDYEIVLVDDNSKDSTPKLCDKFARDKQVRCIHRTSNPGMGAALKEGTKAASGEAVVWVMGDLSDDLDTIPKFVKKIECGADVVFGSRYMPGGNPGDLETTKMFASSGFSRIAKILFQLNVHDITNAFRGFRKSAFDSLKIDSNDFGISPEFALKAKKAGFRLDEVPTGYKRRKAGKATFKMGRMGLKYGKIMLAVLFTPKSRIKAQ
ncbi:MAG: glycosyltransferase family 2 protein [archaeon]